MFFFVETRKKRIYSKLVNNSFKYELRSRAIPVLKYIYIRMSKDVKSSIQGNQSAAYVDSCTHTLGAD